MVVIESVFNATQRHLRTLWSATYLDHYVDFDYISWVAWVWYPVVISFVLPIVIVILLYSSALFLHIYKWRRQIVEAYHHDIWDGARKTLAALWDGQGKIWHGYEVVGLDNIPDTGAALIVYYHGAIPIDMYYIMAKCILHKSRQIRAVGDKFLFKIPGFKLLMEVFCVLPGTVPIGVQLLKEGHVMAIAPGGVREALFSDEYYNTLWGKRTGFARIAIEAQVPIIPMFTQNTREAFRSLGLFKGWLRKIYEKTRLPLVPIYGGFPVKMRTFIGNPINYTDGVSPEQLSKQVQCAIQDLINKHQRIPGTIHRALLDRFTYLWR